MDSTHIKSLIESVAGPIIKNALEARPDNGNGYGLALTAFLVLGLAAVAAVVLIYNRQGKATAAHIAALNKQIKDQAVCAEKVQAIEARLNEHKGENTQSLYKLQLEEIGKRDATREQIIDLLNREFDGLRGAINSRIGSIESRLEAVGMANQSLRESLLVMQVQLNSKNDPPKEGGK